jgi:hypothetical protein
VSAGWLVGEPVLLTPCVCICKDVITWIASQQQGLVFFCIIFTVHFLTNHNLHTDEMHYIYIFHLFFDVSKVIS